MHKKYVSYKNSHTIYKHIMCFFEHSYRFRIDLEFDKVVTIGLMRYLTR